MARSSSRDTLRCSAGSPSAGRRPSGGAATRTDRERASAGDQCVVSFGGFAIRTAGDRDSALRRARRGVLGLEQSAAWWSHDRPDTRGRLVPRDAHQRRNRRGAGSPGPAADVGAALEELAQREIEEPTLERDTAMELENRIAMSTRFATTSTPRNWAPLRDTRVRTATVR